MCMHVRLPACVCTLMCVSVCVSCFLEKVKPTGREWDQPKRHVCGLMGPRESQTLCTEQQRCSALSITLLGRGLSCCSREWWPGTLYFVPDLSAT